MTITSTKMGDIVVNVMGEGDDFVTFREFVMVHTVEWTEVGILWDMNRMDFGKVTSASVRRLIFEGREAAKPRANLKTAFVVGSDVGFGMMRMFCMVAESELPIIFNVFRDEASAITWLREAEPD